MRMAADHTGCAATTSTIVKPERRRWLLRRRRRDCAGAIRGICPRRSGRRMLAASHLGAAASGQYVGGGSMKTKRIKARSSWMTTVLLAATVGCSTAFAQEPVGPTTPGAIPNPGTYQGSMQIQQQQDQQAQQFRDQQNAQFQQNMRQQQSAAPAAVPS